jgi:hypothetical protein
VATVRNGIVLTVLILAVSRPSAGQLTADLVAGRDATLYENATGSVANGSGQHLFAGRTGQSPGIRRALIWFDVAGGIPAAAVVDSAVVTLNMSKTSSGAVSVSLHLATQEWGEGSSDAAGEEGSGTGAASGDATWIHRALGGANWGQPGGDFESPASSTRQVAGLGSYSWRGAGLTGDVQAWLNGTAGNFGWAVVGEEGMARTAKRFDSREFSEASDRPSLRVFYSIPTAIEELPSGDLDLVMYPNPVERGGVIHLEAPGQRASIVVYDLLGRLVSRRPAQYGPAALETGQLAPGSYLVVVGDGAGTRSRILTVR